MSADAPTTRGEVATEEKAVRPVPLWFKLALLGCVIVFILFFLAFASSVSTGFQG